jgi:hypothetical protein
MSESAIHLVDEVLPIKPIRQWVISFPIQIRLLLAVRPKIMSEVLNIVTNTISKHLCKKAGFKKSQAKAGVVTLFQRFGGSINLNVHFHQLYLDGVYEKKMMPWPDSKQAPQFTGSPSGLIRAKRLSRSRLWLRPITTPKQDWSPPTPDSRSTPESQWQVKSAKKSRNFAGTSQGPPSPSSGFT